MRRMGGRVTPDGGPAATRLVFSASAQVHTPPTSCRSPPDSALRSTRRPGRSRSVEAAVTGWWFARWSSWISVAWGAKIGWLPAAAPSR
jgi:hypothetical protein